MSGRSSVSVVKGFMSSFNKAFLTSTNSAADSSEDERERDILTIDNIRKSDLAIGMFLMILKECFILYVIIYYYVIYVLKL